MIDKHVQRNISVVCLEFLKRESPMTVIFRRKHFHEWQSIREIRENFLPRKKPLNGNSSESQVTLINCSSHGRPLKHQNYKDAPA